MTGNPGSKEPSIRVELTTGDELGVLPASRGVSPLGDRSLDERHSLVIDGHRIVVRAISAVLVRVQSHHGLVVGGRRNQPTASTNTKVAKSRASNRRG
jgi:hypothetical protein